VTRASIGIGLVGAGRVGGRRAKLTSFHPAARMVAIADADPAKAGKLAEESGATWSGSDNDAVLDHPDVDAVIVSTSEGQHLAPVLGAIERGKPVLVEKPIALTVADADAILEAAARRNVEVRVGYSRRFKRSYLMAREQIGAGKLGTILSATARAYNGRSHHSQVLKRTPGASAVIAGLTYYIDIVTWFMGDNPPVDVYARSQTGYFKKAGLEIDDVTWAIVTHADGAVATFGVDYALPAGYPTFGPGERVEVLGDEGVILIDHDMKDQILFTDNGIPHSYVPDHGVNMAFMSSSSTGDWALGDFWGPLADETRSWLDHLVTGRPCALATAEEARRTLEITLAIEASSARREPVTIPLA
jgi:predicted dehydrogenase